ncbi:MAG: hypothetical protein ABSB29_05285 [Nitrososphaerales archaeon]
MPLEELVRRKPDQNSVTWQFLTVTLVIPVRRIPALVSFVTAPLIMCPAQSSVMPLRPMTSPSPEQGPRLALRVVSVVIVAPHTTGADGDLRESSATRATAAKRTSATTTATAEAFNLQSTTPSRVVWVVINGCYQTGSNLSLSILRRRLNWAETTIGFEHIEKCGNGCTSSGLC